MLPPDVLGWCAAALMVATFACRDARRMRPLAVATNLAFIGYGVAAALAPVLALHALLLPINLWRWAEARGAGVPALSTTTTPVPWRTAAMVLVFMLLAACSGGGEPEPAPPEFVQVGRVVEISAIQADGRHIEAETNHLVGPERCGEPGEDRASVEMGGAARLARPLGDRHRLWAGPSRCPPPPMAASSSTAPASRRRPRRARGHADGQAGAGVQREPRRHGDGEGDRHRGAARLRLGAAGSARDGLATLPLPLRPVP